MPFELLMSSKDLSILKFLTSPAIFFTRSKYQTNNNLMIFFEDLFLEDKVLVIYYYVVYLNMHLKNRYKLF